MLHQWLEHRSTKENRVHFSARCSSRSDDPREQLYARSKGSRHVVRRAHRRPCPLVPCPFVLCPLVPCPLVLCPLGPCRSAPVVADARGSHDVRPCGLDLTRNGADTARPGEKRSRWRKGWRSPIILMGRRPVGGHSRKGASDGRSCRPPRWSSRL